MNEACHIVIFGGLGDLAMRKLFPALFRLMARGHLPSSGLIVGVSPEGISSGDFRTLIRNNLIEHLGAETSGFDETIWQEFAKKLCYVAMDGSAPESFQNLSRKLDSDSVPRPLIVYLATEPLLFGVICANLRAANLVDSRSRLVLEKPLGMDLPSSMQIHNQVAQVFTERQIYRIDHYLGKETVQNLIAVRFGNALFEPLWNATAIDHVQITVAEKVGVANRYRYYEKVGALRDMVQNHLLQLLCLVAMEPPSSLDAQAVRDEKVKVIRSLRPIERHEINRCSVRGQYMRGQVDGLSVSGYLDEGCGEASSNAETFVALRVEIENWRWAGVPFYLRTGKRLPHRYSEIVIQFKQLPHSIFDDMQARSPNPNKLIIRLQPEESIQLMIMNKQPGLDEQMLLSPVSLNLSLTEAFHLDHTPLAHERLLLDVLRDNQTLFVRRDEVEAAWSWVDKIQDGWQKLDQRAIPYPAGSWGPLEARDLIARDGRSWHDS